MESIDFACLGILVWCEAYNTCLTNQSVTSDPRWVDFFLLDVDSMMFEDVSSVRITSGPVKVTNYGQQGD